MHLFDERAEVLGMAERTQSRGPHDDVSYRSVEQRNEPAVDLVFRFAPFPADVRNASVVKPQREHAGEPRAPHQTQDVHTAAIPKAARMKNQKIKDGAERKDQNQIEANLQPRTSRWLHECLTTQAVRNTVLKLKHK